MRPLYSLLLLTGSLVVGSLTGAFAQSSSGNVPGWYVGVGAGLHQYAQPETVHSEGTSSPYQLQPVYLAVGHQFARGFGLEASAMYHRRDAVANSSRLYEDRDSYFYYSNENAEAFAVSVLLRVPLLHTAAGSRWQLDGRGGLTYLMTRFTEKRYYVLALNPGPTEPTFEKRRTLGDLPITLGLGASYRLSPHFQLTADADAHVSWVLCIAKLFGTTGSPIGGGGGIGVRYSL